MIGEFKLFKTNQDEVEQIKSFINTLIAKYRNGNPPKSNLLWHISALQKDIKNCRSVEQITYIINNKKSSMYTDKLGIEEHKYSEILSFIGIKWPNNIKNLKDADIKAAILGINHDNSGEVIRAKL